MRFGIVLTPGSSEVEAPRSLARGNRNRAAGIPATLKMRSNACEFPHGMYCQLAL
jgi:hypothetical protein